MLQNMTTLNMASRESMKKAQVISCPLLPELEATLSEVWSESTIYSISITDAVGRNISPGPESWWSGQEANLDISSLRSGLYYLKIQSPSALKIERIVKK